MLSRTKKRGIGWNRLISIALKTLSHVLIWPKTCYTRSVFITIVWNWRKTKAPPRFVKGSNRPKDILCFRRMLFCAILVVEEIMISPSNDDDVLDSFTETFWKYNQYLLCSPSSKSRFLYTSTERFTSNNVQQLNEMNLKEIQPGQYFSNDTPEIGRWEIHWAFADHLHRQ